MKNKLQNILNNRKTLFLILGILVVSVFTLSIAYAAMEAVLTISGNSEITSSTWDIHLANVKVKDGSVASDTPKIVGTSSVSFGVDLNLPGDFYQFTVDVVNDGTVDAMIDSVVKTPELTEEQAKYIKYEITYENGESISTKQNLKKKTSIPIKVRVEYRKDLVAEDLPQSETELSLKLTLVYVQSDGSGSGVLNNGVYNPVNIVSGDGTKLGDEVCIGEECFYVISSDDTSITMLAKYNLYVGNEVLSIEYNSDTFFTNQVVNTLNNPTGIQNSFAKGGVSDFIFGQVIDLPWIGTIEFSSSNYWDDNGLKEEYGVEYPVYVYDSNSSCFIYVDDYEKYLSTLGVTQIKARLMSFEEASKLGCVFDVEQGVGNCDSAPSWIYSSSYFLGSAKSSSVVWFIGNMSNFSLFAGGMYYWDYVVGIRPVIVMSKSQI